MNRGKKIYEQNKKTYEACIFNISSAKIDIHNKPDPYKLIEQYQKNNPANKNSSNNNSTNKFSLNNSSYQSNLQQKTNTNSTYKNFNYFNKEKQKKEQIWRQKQQKNKMNQNKYKLSTKQQIEKEKKSQQQKKQFAEQNSYKFWYNKKEQNYLRNNQLNKNQDDIDYQLDLIVKENKRNQNLMQLIEQLFQDQKQQ